VQKKTAKSLLKAREPMEATLTILRSVSPLIVHNSAKQAPSVRVRAGCAPCSRRRTVTLSWAIPKTLSPRQPRLC
jgi:hypothetical protein